jgi:ferredoxin
VTPPGCAVHAIADSFDLSPRQLHWVERNAEGSARRPLILGRQPALATAEARRAELGFQ